MGTISKKALNGSLLAALGLTSLSPVQQGAALVAAGTAALWASPALAQTGIPGVGVVVKKKPGNAPIIAPSDANGEVRITGLEPGEYSVRVIEGAEEVTMRVGRDGRLAFVAWEDAKAPDPRAADPRARRALPVVRRWAEQIAFDKGSGPTGPAAIRGSSVIVALLALGINVDVNTSDVDAIARETRNTPEAARAIVAERTRGGPFKDMIDFAQRVGPLAAVDFEDASVKFGEQTLLVNRGTGSPKNAGFKMGRGTSDFSLFGTKHSYVGHVTLLR